MSVIDDWDDNLKVGLDIVDNQHKILYDLIKDLNNAIATGVNKKILDAILGVLRDYAFQHFQTEEELFKNHATSTDHCLEHYALIKRMNTFILDFKNNRRPKDRKDIQVLLQEWLFQHIERFDKPSLSRKIIPTRLSEEFVDIDEFEPDFLEERRHHKRIPHNEVVEGHIFANCYNAMRLKSGRARIIDMSPGGLMLDSPNDHAIDDLLIITCSIGKNFKMTEKATVRTIHDKKYGVQFIAPAEATISFFTNLYGSVHLNRARTD